jgi:LysM repeat protein
VDLAVLEALNPTIPNFNLIFPGQVINLPKQSGGTHIVEEGDSLYALALAFNIDFTCLIDGNRQLANPNLIFPGDVISIPATCPPFNPAEVPPITVTQITHITTISTVASSKPPEPSPVTGIVIGGTTYPIGTGSSTITQSDGSTIIFGPGGVVIGTQTISLPPVTRPTTFTSGGQTITLGTGNGPTITTRPQTSSEIVIEGSTYTIGPGKLQIIIVRSNRS